MPELAALFVGRKPRERLFEPISMESAAMDGRWRALRKPLGGLWTCPDSPDGVSDWRVWDQDAGAQFTRRMRTWRVTARDPRVLLVDSYADLVAVQARYPWTRPEFEELRGLTSEIDFVAMAGDYDVFVLTLQGHAESRFTYPLTTYGYDVPTLLWLRWCFSRVESVRSARRPGRPGRYRRLFEDVSLESGAAQSPGRLARASGASGPRSTGR